MGINIKTALLLIALTPAGAQALNTEWGYEYWDLSFFSPSRIWSLRLQERGKKGTGYIEYYRTSRFKRQDNTVHGGIVGKLGPLGWDLKAGFTPKAAVLYRQISEVIFYLPSPGYTLEPFVRGNYRRFTDAKVTTGEAGLRFSPLSGWDASVRAGYIQTALEGPATQNKDAGSQSYQLGYTWKEALRIFTFYGSWREFFDSGNPSNPGEYSIAERGGGLSWALISAGKLKATHSQERRSNGASIKKYSLAVETSF
ncbi:MAG: hypothetical protein HYT79_01170 [Elusimicrobia bacterium]|nr:hypothetical protein [Elusimicrobiota bacterium]